MFQASRLIATVMAATVGLLTACAAPAPQDPAVTQASAGESAVAPEVITGSRIPVKSTEKLVRQIGAQSSQDAMRNLPPNAGMPSQ